MNSLLQFAYESGICLVFLYGIYYIFLRKETYFKLNRLFLLGTIFFSIIIPLLSMSTLFFASDSTAYKIISSVSGTVTFPEFNFSSTSGIADSSIKPWQYLLLTFYLAGVAILLTRFIVGIIKVVKLNKYGKYKGYKGYSLLTIKEDLAPFSFFRAIYVNESQTKSSQLEHIIEHELVHIRQLHSIDIMITEIFLALFWFNPFIWLIRKSLKNTHEYLADKGVKKSTSNLRDYQSLLLIQINALSPLSIANNFNSIIKSRIKMMYKSNSTGMAKLKPLLIIPVILSLVLVFSCSDEEDEFDTTVTKSTVVEEQVFFQVDEMPKFNGGDPAMEFRKYIGKNLSYPTIASDNGISGRVIVQFAVNSAGEVVDAVVVRGADQALDKEAVRVIMSSPKWKAGKQGGKKVKVLFTFPINFVMD